MRKCITILVVSILLGASAFAQYKQTGGFARLRGMGNNPFIIDPYFMTVNPAWAGHYQNFLFGDLGSQSTPWGSGGIGQFIAANFHVGGGLTLGAILTRNDFNNVSIGNPDPFSRLDGAGTTIPGGPFGVVNRLNSIVGGAAAIALNNNVELLGSYKKGNTSFGLGIAIASSTNEATFASGGTSTVSASQLGFNAGIITKFSGNFMLDVGASLMLPSAKYEPATGNTSEVSQTIILANARVFWQYSSKLTFVPSLTFSSSSGTFENGNTATTTSGDLPSYSLLVFGIGTNYIVGDFLFAAGPGFATASSTINSTDTSPELTNSAFVFPIWNLGVEWNLTDWFVGRFGYVAATASVTNEQQATTTTVNEFIMTQFLPVGATVGVGFRLGNFSLDATVNEDVLRQGLNNIGGNGPNANTFAYLSLSYAMP
jgi:hypothetical protein